MCSRYGIKYANGDRNITMEKINLKVAYCKLCNGYRSSIATSEINNNHAEVIDHYLYHGSPWFTFDKEIFSQIISQRDIVIREVRLSTHKESDRNYCKCPQFTTYDTLTVVAPQGEIRNDKVITDFSDTEYYFRDVYHLASMFH